MTDVSELFNKLHRKYAKSDRVWYYVCNKFNKNVTQYSKAYNLNFSFLSHKLKDWKMNYVLDIEKHAPRVKILFKRKVVCILTVDNGKVRIMSEECKVPKKILDPLTAVLETCWKKIITYKPNIYDNIYFAFRMAITMYLHGFDDYCRDFEGENYD